MDSLIQLWTLGRAVAAAASPRAGVATGEGAAGRWLLSMGMRDSGIAGARTGSAAAAVGALPTTRPDLAAEIGGHAGTGIAAEELAGA